MASYTDLRQIDSAPAPGGWLRAFPLAPLLGALAVALAVTVALRPEPVANPLPSFLAAHLGASTNGAALVARPTPGVRLEVDGAGYHAAGRSSRVSVTPESGVGGSWLRFQHGRSRKTEYGHDTVAVRRDSVEEFLTVQRRQGIRTWRWRLATPGSHPRVASNGAVGFVTRHRLGALEIEPVQILSGEDARLNVAGARWSVRRSGGSWWLELRLDDRTLPLPYVIDPSVTVRGANTGVDAGGSTTFTINAPAGVSAGDVMLAQVAARNAPTISVTGGWTSISRVADGGSNIVQEIVRRTAAAGEPASYTVTLGSAQKAAGGIVGYVGVDTY